MSLPVRRTQFSHQPSSPKTLPKRLVVARIGRGNLPTPNGGARGQTVQAKGLLPRLLVAAVTSLLVAGAWAHPTSAVETRERITERSVQPDPQPESEKSARTVTLVLYFGDGFEKRYTKLPWKEGMTVLDAMRLAEKHARSTSFRFRGEKDTAFLTQIDDLANEGAGGKNWIYRVNDKLGDRSFAIYPLRAADTVLWSFGEYP